MSFLDSELEVVLSEELLKEVEAELGAETEEGAIADLLGAKTKKGETESKTEGKTDGCE